MSVDDQDIVIRLRIRAQIRKKIPRAEPDRISKDCEEAASLIVELRGWRNFCIGGWIGTFCVLIGVLLWGVQ